MSFGIPVRNGLAIGLTPSSTLASGRGRGRLPTDGSPTLILDFVGSAFETNQSLSLNFTQQAYSVYQTDPNAPPFANFWVWR
jgi:hypothetical protein